MRELVVIMLLSAFSLCSLMVYLVLVRPQGSGQYVMHGLGAIIAISIAGALFSMRSDEQHIEKMVSRWFAVMAISASFFVLVPVTLERSVSTYLLQTFKEHPQQVYDVEQLNALLRTDYICHRNAAGKRMREQRMLGLVHEIQPQHYQLSDTGSKVISVLDTMYGLFTIPTARPSPGCRGKN